MVTEITVENLAIIEKAHIQLGPGLTVLTGETGAGKSLLVDALELALGERADTELVRTGAAKASVSVVLDLSDEPELQKKCYGEGLAVEDSALYIQREVFAEGKSQARVCGKLTPISMLKQAGAWLVDLHGQHEHQTLFNPERHLDYLDAWIGAPARTLQEEVRKAFETLQEAKAKLAALQTSVRDREHRLDLLRFQVQEIESISPVAGEMDQLEAELSRLTHAEKLRNATADALGKLRGDEDSALDLLGVSLKEIEDCLKFDPTLEPILEPLRASLYSLEEGTRVLSDYGDRLESDPQALEATADRIDALKRLRRKYGEDEQAVLAYLAKAAEELESLVEFEFNEAALADRVLVHETEVVRLCADLSALRHQRAHEFSDLVEAQLRDLAMEKACFEARVATKAPSADGADRVEFFFSANPGEAAKPLAKIASGGEISRVMLAIKTVLAGKAGVPTLIFDEVDAGLSGRAAAVLARKLEELATHYQVLVISHLPQIASRALTHFRIEKLEAGGRVATSVRLLSAEDRVEEIARMLAGEQVTDSARSNARELLSGSLNA